MYHQIDEECSHLEHSICSKGCSDCCSDYFQISCVEFFTILHHIGVDAELVLKASDWKAMASLDGIDLPMKDFINIPNLAPCIFLDDTTNECKIYEVRPIICRSYGNYRELTRCNKITDNSNAKNLMLSAKGKVYLQNNIDVLGKTKNLL